MPSLDELRRKAVKRIIGLMSGTSADGVSAALVEVRLKLHPGRVVDKVLVDSGDELLVLASSENLETAVREVTEAAQKLLMKALDVDRETALALLSLTSNLGISQVVNPRKTAKFSIPKRVLNLKLEKLLKIEV